MVVYSWFSRKKEREVCEFACKLVAEMETEVLNLYHKFL